MVSNNYIIGNVYGILELLELFRDKDKYDNRLGAVVKCTKCGKIRTIMAIELYRGGCSCKCQLHNAGESKTRLYNIYYNMIKRCNNKNLKIYKYYGGRGIKVCDEWSGDNGYESFRNWAINNGYNDTLSIDRINNDGNYEPNNCQWISMSENLGKANKINIRNKSKYGMYYGIDPNGNYYEFDNASAFAREHNLNQGNISNVALKKQKLHKGWKFGFVNECETM